MAAWDDLVTIRLASPGCSSSQVIRCSLTVVSTSERMVVLPSLVFVWPSNCGSRKRTLAIAIRPSRTSSPRRFSSFSFNRPLLRAYRLITLVSAFLRPSSCMPPSCVLIVFAKEWIDSEYPFVHWRAMSASASNARASIEMTLVWIVSLPVARCFTKSAIPPEALKTCLTGLASRSSISWISTPLVRNACSWSRSASSRLSNSTPSTKISGSGQNVMIVPVFLDGLPLVSFEVALPRA